MEYKIKIEQDEFPFNPRKESDTYTKFITFHGRYSIGDKHEYSDPNALNEFMDSHNVIKLPVYMFDHSGITIATTPFSCPWDSGQIGYIFATREDILKEFNVNHITPDIRDKVIAFMKAEITEYDHYITGNVWRYRIFEVDDDGEELDEVDSCWGFFGDEEYCREEANNALKHIKEQEVA